MSIKQARLIVNAHKHNLLINSFCNGPLSSFQGRSSSASSVHACLLQAIDGCDALGFVPAGSVKRVSSLTTCGPVSYTHLRAHETA